MYVRNRRNGGIWQAVRGGSRPGARIILSDRTKEAVMAVEEEDLPIRKRTRLDKLVLDMLGIEELRDYIGELKDEIARVEADIARKNSHRSAADAFFRKPG
jgi:uncharacterized small protein (DUF1192 family)